MDSQNLKNNLYISQPLHYNVIYTTTNGLIIIAHIERNKNLLPNAKKLRKEMTPQENKLWYKFLKSYPLHIYKQRIIANYIVDFYCPKAKLVIEIDGSQHYTADGLEYDAIRTEALEVYNLQVVRVTNLEIDKNFDCICEYLDNLLKEKVNEL